MASATVHVYYSTVNLLNFVHTIMHTMHSYQLYIVMHNISLLFHDESSKKKKALN